MLLAAIRLSTNLRKNEEGALPLLPQWQQNQPERGRDERIRGRLGGGAATPSGGLAEHKPRKKKKERARALSCHYCSTIRPTQLRKGGEGSSLE